LHKELPWNDGALSSLEEVLEALPMLVRISAAKRLRDAAERNARHLGHENVQEADVAWAKTAALEGVAA